MDERIPSQFFDVTQIYNTKLVSKYMPAPYPQDLQAIVNRGLMGHEIHWSDKRRRKVEAAFAFDAIENRREVEHLALDAVEDLHARHGQLPVLKG